MFQNFDSTFDLVIAPCFSCPGSPCAPPGATPWLCFVCDQDSFLICLCVAIDVDPSHGLPDDEVEKRRSRFGYNELAEEEGRSFLAMVLEQFDDPLVKILLAAAVISTLLAVNETISSANMDVNAANDFQSVAQFVYSNLTLDRFVEPLVILFILFLNAAVGVWQESNAEASLEALKKMQPATATVLRNGTWHHEMPSRELLPGDIVQVTVGQVVPADCRLLSLKTTTIRTEEMALTGESSTVLKHTDAVGSLEGPSVEIQGRKNMLFSGTSVSNGTAIAVVTATSLATELGKIQEQIQEASEMKAEEKTPLKQKLSDFSEQLQYIIGFVCLLVWLINYKFFIDFETYTIDFKACVYYFQVAVALAVAAIPEGLPTVITMCLALGTRKMAAKKAIVRRLPAVETLGCTTVICSDKTGTLTTNQMSAKCVVIMEAAGAGKLGEMRTELSGSSYNPKDGIFKYEGDISKEPCLQQLAKIASLCNESDIVLNEDDEEKGQVRYQHVGMPTEAALRILVEKMLQNTIPVTEAGRAVLPANDTIAEKYEKVAVLEFTRDRKSMSVITNSKSKTNQNELLVKGAPENVLARCTSILLRDGSVEKLTPQHRSVVLQSIETMAEKAWRCLGFAFSQDLTKFGLHDYEKEDQEKRPNRYLADPGRFVEVESGLVFVGAVGLRDPPREEVKQSISDCYDAGISVVVITGDNKQTAEAICKDIGVFDTNEDLSELSFLGAEFGVLPVEEQLSKLYGPSGVRNLVFSRCEPKFKQDIVKLLKERNEVVAMTGDGVNDAPALKLADIGIAMGITGTEVAKAASDMVLADDNFSTIVSAIEEGRSIYNNMKAFIRYMISSNIGEVASIFFTAALGIPEGLIPVQLLWVNLVTDGPPATALGFNPADPGIMKQPPRNKEDELISKWLLFRYLVVGLYVGVATVGIFVVWYTQNSFFGIDLSEDGHATVQWSQLLTWEQCKEEDVAHITSYKTFGMDAVSSVDFTGCEYFGPIGKQKASTLSLSVLVTIEMFNALNALSENESLLVVTPLVNPYLLLAMLSSFVSHFLILYIPALSAMFDVVPLSVNEWLLVILFSFPVILIDELLKLIGRAQEAQQLAARKKQQ